MKDFFISENDFRIWLPEVSFEKSAEEAYNSRKIRGVMSTQRRDRQGENVISKGLDFEEFLRFGHFNDNHSQETSAIVGYPENVQYHEDLSPYGLPGGEGWACEGFILKGTSRADGIWELAQSLVNVPHRKLGFSIEGKVLRRSDKTIEKAKIRNVAVTNCPVNTDCTWNLLSKSFESPDIAMKAMTAGYGVSPSTQGGGGALRSEDLDSDAKDLSEKKKKKILALKKAFEFDDLYKAMELVMEQRPELDEETAALVVKFLSKKGDFK